MKALLILVVLGLVAASNAFGTGIRGQGSAGARGFGGLGGKAGATGTIDTGAHVGGSASAGNVGFLSGLFTMSDVKAQGEAEGHLKAAGTAGAEFGARGGGEGFAEGAGAAGINF